MAIFQFLISALMPFTFIITSNPRISTINSLSAVVLAVSKVFFLLKGLAKIYRNSNLSIKQFAYRDPLSRVPLRKMNGSSTWFSPYTDFAHDPTTGLKSNFDRLAVQRKWGRKLKAKRWSDCQTAMFASLYGHDTEVSKLERWQDLCREVLISSPPNSISGCRKV